MKTKILPFFVTLALLSTMESRAQDEMPILGWRAVPAEETSVERFLEMKECGLNAFYSIYDTEEQLLRALDVADSVGIRVVPFYRDLFGKSIDLVPEIDGRASLLCYFLRDEPYRENFPQVRETIDILRKAGATKPVYVNINPYYDNKMYADMGYSNYAEYIEEYVAEVDPPFISFDFYPFINRNEMRSTWYENIQLIRDEAISSGKPFWAFVLSTPHLNLYPQTIEQLRYQVNVDLAYGAQAIQYFTYWQPNHMEGGIEYYDAPISLEGERTETYYKIKQVNAELKEVAPYFYKGKIKTVMHVTDSFESAEISSAEGAIASILTTAAGDKYLVFVNKSLDVNMSVKYQGKTYDVVPGGIVLIPN